MPLKRGKSKRVFEENLHELKRGPQHKRTANKFGEERAHAQDLAIAFKEKRRGKKRKR